jgi:hypothetical protein
MNSKFLNKKIKKVSSTMAAGSILYQGMALVSPNGQYMAKMQNDGNLVVFNGNQETGSVVWATATNGNYLAYLSFQTDANLVVFSSAAAVKWSSNVYGAYTASSLSLQMFE